jgi:hypothetical protein
MFQEHEKKQGFENLHWFKRFDRFFALNLHHSIKTQFYLD